LHAKGRGSNPRRSTNKRTNAEPWLVDVIEVYDGPLTNRERGSNPLPGELCRIIIWECSTVECAGFISRRSGFDSRLRFVRRIILPLRATYEAR
jgi:hypothetical protein